MIEVQNINKSFPIDYSRKQKVLTDISFILDKGQRMTIVGPSGSGKSTLLNIIGTLDKPDNGSVIFNGQLLNNLEEKQLADLRNNNFGFIFQSHQLLPQLSLIENILVPTIPKTPDFKKVAKKRGLELLDSMGLADHINKLPGQLSGGECQRAAVVRSLINNPELVLADEPTGSLDEENGHEIGKLLLEINKVHNVSIIVVTHSLTLSDTIGNVHNLINGEIRS